MSELKKFCQILSPSIKISKVSLSYVNRLFPEFKGSSCIILHKEQPMLKTPSNDVKTEYTDKDETSQFDITGSPLKYTFDEINFEDTIIMTKRNWRKKEEKYLPLSRIEACNLLNACLEHINDNSSPILALCDGKDKKQSRLLGTIICGEWFTSIEVCSKGIETLAEIKNSTKFFQEHLKLQHVQEHDVTVSAFNTFNLFGTREEMIDWNENLKSNFEGSITVEVYTDSLSLYPPTRASKNNLVIQMVTGANNSLLRELWKQLLLLDQYLTIIEKYKQSTSSQYDPLPLQFPNDLKAPYREEHDNILENLNLLLSGDYSFRNSNGSDLEKTDFTSEENEENDIKIEQYIQTLPFRYNLDLTDFLWELLIKNTNYFQMTKCIHTVLEETVSDGYLSQVNFTNATRFAQVISNPHPQKMISHLLSGSSPLEYVVDMGLEKLCRDYMYILINARFSEICNIQQNFGNVSSGDFNVDTYRKKLVRMAQIHVCLEFMLLVQNNLECPTESLRPLFSCAFNQFGCEESPIRNHADLHQNTIISLTVPLPISMIDDLNKEIPVTRRISLSSQTKLSQLTSTRYYSRLPIFPTCIYSTVLDDSNIVDETYHVTSVICSANKFK